MPTWLRPAKGHSLQSIIASAETLEALAQLMLSVLRCRELALPRGDYFTCACRTCMKEIEGALLLDSAGRLS